MNAQAERLAWALEAGRGRGALFGVWISSDEDLHALSPALEVTQVANVFLDADASRALMLQMIKGDASLPSTDTIILTDVLASSTAEIRRQLNRSRETWLTSGRCFVFAERKAGSPQILAELRDFVAVFREHVDLRPDLGHDDDLWDTGSAGSLNALADYLPTTTRGATIVVGGRIRHKQKAELRCPDCGQRLPTETTTIEISFEYAPAETAKQQLLAYRCACGSEWPAPQGMRAAHARAFSLGAASRFR